MGLQCCLAEVCALPSAFLVVLCECLPHLCVTFASRAYMYLYDVCVLMASAITMVMRGRAVLYIFMSENSPFPDQV